MTRRIHFFVPVRSVVLGVSEAILATMALVWSMIAYLGPLKGRIGLVYERAVDARVALVVILFVLCMYYFDLYNLSVLRNSLKIVTNLVRCIGALLLLLTGIYSMFPAVRLQHEVVLVGTGTAAIGALCWRQLFRRVSHWPAFQERVLILGDGQLGAELAGMLNTQSELGYRVVCRFTSEHDSTADLAESSKDSSELMKLVRSHKIGRVVVTMGERRGRLPVDTLLELKENGIAVQDGSELYESITGKVYLDSLRPSTLLFSPAFEVSYFSMFCQRLMSLIVSLIALIFAAPLMLVIAIAIRIDSPGPIIFRQKRVGLRGELFTLYKFRSMRNGADAISPAREKDERFTRLGLRLRASRLDELPQLWNILRGDMHLVGPRPFVPEQEDYLRVNLPYYKLRWSVPPGATGWAQVSRGYCTTLEDNADKLAFDLFYIKNFSIGFDMLVLLKTAKILVLGRGAR